MPAAPQAKPPASTQPLTVDASGEGKPNTPKVSAPVQSEEVKDLFAAMASAPFKENADGSITVDLDYPPDISFAGIPNMTVLKSVTLQRAVWKRRRAAARRYPVNHTTLDQDTCLIAELSGLPEHVLDELDGRDMGLVQMALGKLLYSQRMLSAP